MSEKDFNLLYDTAFLAQVVPNLFVAQNWLLDSFFPNIVLSDTESVAIDVEVGARRMSPFCSPLVEGPMVEALPYQTNIFKPAYIKDKRVPDLLRPVRRMIGERLGGREYTPAERAMLNLQYEMADQINMLNRRLEWMAAQAL
ncbi:TPA: major capsid protein, partial [Escherichia coli]